MANMITIYDKELELLDKQIAEAKARLAQFLAPIRKRKNILQVMRHRALKGDDAHKFVKVGAPDEWHLIPDKVKQILIANGTVHPNGELVTASSEPISGSSPITTPQGPTDDEELPADLVALYEAAPYEDPTTD